MIEMKSGELKFIDEENLEKFLKENKSLIKNRQSTRCRPIKRSI